MKRRVFICSAASSLCMCSRAFSQFPGDGGDYTADQEIDHESSNNILDGCSLTSAGFDLFSTASQSSQFRSSTGNTQIDLAFKHEVSTFLVRLFGHNPDYCYYDDSAGANAFATPEQLIGNGEGTVAIGINLMKGIFSRFANTSLVSMGDHAIVAVIAHEFGHIAQFNRPMSQISTHKKELHADFLSGWYMGFRAKQLQGMQIVNVQEAATQMFEIGSFDFNNPNFHGTPDERRMAFTSGAYSNMNSLDDAFEAGKIILGI